MQNGRPSILITGANGFLGSRLCKKFVHEKYKVIAGVRKSADLSLLERLDIKFRIGDIKKPETLSEMVKDVDFIIHNAGLVKAKSIKEFFEVNEQGTKNLFEAVKNYSPNLKKIIYISSMAASGPSLNGHPVKESDTSNPITAYGKSKLAGEKIALSYKEFFPVVSIRPPGVYGPADKEMFSFFKAVYMRLKPLFGDTSRQIQLVHVDDLCRGIFLALGGGKNGEIYFISENKPYSMKELIKIIEKSSGRSGMPLYLPSGLFRLMATISEYAGKLVGLSPMLNREKAKELLSSWVVDCSKAKRDFGYESKIDFSRGTKETYQWYIERGWL